MAEDYREIKIGYTLKHCPCLASSNETAHIFPVSRCKAALVLIPAFIALELLSAFIFSFLLFYGIILSLWIWWLRRELRKPRRVENLEGNVVIEEIRVVETKSDKEDD